MDLAYHSLNLRTQAPQERCLSGLGPAGVSLTVPATGQILIENGQEKKKKPGPKLQYDPAIPVPGICPEETITEKDTGITILTAALFTLARV